MAPTKASKNEYVVEKILAKRSGTYGVEYLVKWEGWAPSSNTWEPISHINCPRLVAKFEKEAKTKEKAPNKASARNDYNVEKIVGKRAGDKGTEYLIKWEGYSLSANTWEPIRNLNCPKLVQKYEEDNSGAPKPELPRKSVKRPLATTETATSPVPRRSGNVAFKKIKSVKKENGELHFLCEMSDCSEKKLSKHTVYEK
ncbi:hypothetical protein GCK72_022444 [Caenorhabditis remanei]|uniref:Chromo domain-containing protein n=2 Tax=Caenorhabditis remanei TaxID=31234 RepID=A0A6A5FTW6_CAERE|nr:hypothetical protein GCK72_022444 [Caenorhabditis remanei]KAF1745993.1 hypothetical protein GCK72_022444 [Caenorhabditis remanei]